MGSLTTATTTACDRLERFLKRKNDTERQQRAAKKNPLRRATNREGLHRGCPDARHTVDDGQGCNELHFCTHLRGMRLFWAPFSLRFRLMTRITLNQKRDWSHFTTKQLTNREITQATEDGARIAGLGVRAPCNSCINSGSDCCSSPRCFS